MDERSRNILDAILNKLPEDLTVEEIAFLKARQNYLTRTQREDFIIILNQTPKGAVKKENAKPHKTKR